jgi:hypothetical protein
MQEYASTQGTMMPSCVLPKAQKCLHSRPDQSRHKNVIKDSACYQPGWHVFSDEFHARRRICFGKAYESRFPRGEDSRAKLLKQGPLSHQLTVRRHAAIRNTERQFFIGQTRLH